MTGRFRAGLLGAVAALGLTGLVATFGHTAPAVAADTIRVCLIDDLSGDFAVYGRPKHLGPYLAAKEINEKGGVLGKQIEIVFYDGQSDVKRNQELAEKCILDDDVNLVMAGTTSSEREAARAVAVKNKVLYWHNNEGEGGIADHYSFFSGNVPEKKTLPSVDWMTNKFGKKVYLLAADYGYGQVSALWTQAAVGLYGGEIVGTEFIPLGNSDFATTIANIQKAKPDWIAAFLVGGAQLNFYPQRAAAGLKLPILGPTHISLTYEHKSYPAPVMQDVYVPFSFVEELPDESAKKFVAGIRSLDKDLPYVNEMARDSYIALNLVAKAWAVAGTTETEATISALESGLSFDAPEGRVFLDPATHHLTSRVQLLHVNAKHEIEFVEDFGQIEPWWLRSLGVNLVRQNDAKQYLPWDDPRLAKFKPKS
jgi:branched-chain amino acid transport system substrate-binding protein